MIHRVYVYRRFNKCKSKIIPAVAHNQCRVSYSQASCFPPSYCEIKVTSSKPCRTGKPLQISPIRFFTSSVHLFERPQNDTASIVGMWAPKLISLMLYLNYHPFVEQNCEVFSLIEVYCLLSLILYLGCTTLDANTCVEGNSALSLHPDVISHATTRNNKSVNTIKVLVENMNIILFQQLSKTHSALLL